MAAEEREALDALAAPALSRAPREGSEAADALESKPLEQGAYT